MPTETCNRVLIERYFLGESGVEEKRSVRLHLDGCDGCRGLLSTLENERRAYLLAHPFRDFAAKHPGASRPDGRSVPGDQSARKTLISSRWLPGLATVAICLILIPLATRFGLRTPEVGEAGVRTKGGPLLEYYLKRGGVVTPGDASEAHRAGDELQFVYSAGRHAYVTLASIDSRGHVSLYRAAPGQSETAPAAGLPDTGLAQGLPAGSLPLSLEARPGERQSLPFAVTLDDSPGSELFVMIFGPEPMAGSAVEGWLTEAFTRASGSLEGLASLLPPPPGHAESASTGSGASPEFKVEKGAADNGRAEIKALLLRKSQA